MSNAVYAAITRQTGLTNELQVVANNLANASTTGYKADRAVFAEFLAGNGEDIEHISMGGLAGHQFDLEQGGLKFTGGQFDPWLKGKFHLVPHTITPEGGDETLWGARFRDDSSSDWQWCTLPPNAECWTMPTGGFLPWAAVDSGGTVHAVYLEGEPKEAFLWRNVDPAQPFTQP